MRLELVRIAYLADCTLGRLRVGELELVTIEEPWRADPDGPGGQRRTAELRESCVPDGTYALVPHNGTRFQNVWRLSNPELGVWNFDDEIPRGQAWGRAAVLIHNGNTTDHIKGCIAIGTAFGRLEDKPAVLFSLIALEKLRAALGSSATHELLIRPTAGTLEA